MPVLISEHDIDIGRGNRVIVRVEKTDCGEGVLVSRTTIINGKKRVHCSGHCGENWYYWECPDGHTCLLNCNPLKMGCT